MAPWLANTETIAMLLSRVIVLVVLAWALLYGIGRLSDYIQQEPPKFETHWGGLGRGLGGWTINKSLATLLLVALLLVAFVGFAFHATTSVPGTTMATASTPPTTQEVKPAAAGPAEKSTATNTAAAK